MSDETEQWVKRMLASPEIKAAEATYCPPSLLATSPRHNPLLESSEEPDELLPLDPNDLSRPENNELLSKPGDLGDGTEEL